MPSTAKPWLVTALTSVALCSFAANSLLCRLALRGGEIDPASFTAIRLCSGAALLSIVLFASRRGEHWWSAGNWVSGAMLWLYAAAFSYAYLGLTAGAGALLLFGFVQATMIGVGMWRSDHPRSLEWLGLVLGLAGLVWLVSPGLSHAPPLASAGLMVAAGAAWGVYSLRGRGSADDPVAATAGNFLRSAPLGILLLLPTVTQAHLTPKGALLALCSGAVTSGLGYVAWYGALRGLTGPRAAIVQFAVPVLAAVGGVLFLAESVTLGLVVASALVIGGVALALTANTTDSKLTDSEPD